MNDQAVKRANASFAIGVAIVLGTIVVLMIASPLPGTLARLFRTYF